MKTFFQEIFEYHNYYNEKVTAQLIANQKLVTQKSIALLSHLLNAHQIWNSRILGLPSLGVHDLHQLQDCIALNKNNFEQSLSVLQTQDLNTMVHYQTSKGERFQNTVRDILFHVINHTTHHRAQIVMELRNNGVAPIVTDYIFYKRTPEKAE